MPTPINQGSQDVSSAPESGTVGSGERSNDREHVDVESKRASRSRGASQEKDDPSVADEEA